MNYPSFTWSLKNILKNTYADYATGEFLDLRAREQGITRYQATSATRRGVFTNSLGAPMSIPLGSRFSTTLSEENVNFYATEIYKDVEGQPVPGNYLLVCETAGTIGNSFIGALMPITFITNLRTAELSDVIIPGRDIETNEELRIRYFQKVGSKSFGGNIAQYDEELKNIDGVGEVQIYPVWDGGGTVKCSVIDAEYNKITNDFINIIQNTIDPENAVGEQGTGLGLAPIGHKVTIVTPTEMSIDVTATVVLKSGYSLPGVSDLINTAISEYLHDLRVAWGISDDLNNYSLAVYLARINYAILSVEGIANVTNTTINGVQSDLILTQNASLQQLPVLGDVVINE